MVDNEFGAELGDKFTACAIWLSSWRTAERER
jgi:hypothetical protein